MIVSVNDINIIIKMKQQLAPSHSSYSLQVSQINNHEQPFTFESQEQSHQYSYIELEGNKLVQDDETEQSEYRDQLEKEYQLRVDSIIKGYQIKIVKEQQTFELKEMKYVQQIEYLKRQLKQFMSINKDATKQKQSNNNAHCSICSNGEVLNFMKNMMQALQTDHAGCLSEKTVLNAKVIALQQKVSVLEVENQQTEQRYQKIKTEQKQLKIQKQTWEREKREKERQFREMEREYQTKQLAFEQQVVKQKIMQKELQNQIRKIQQQHIDDVMRLRQLPIMLPSHKEHRNLKESAHLKQGQREDQQNSIYNNPKYQTIGEQNIDYQLYESHAHFPRQAQERSSRYRHNMEEIEVLRPSLKGSSNINNIVHNMSMSHMGGNMNNAHMAVNWKTKMKQSYADYANQKRNTRRNQNSNSTSTRHAFFDSKPNNNDSFDTFRPTLQQVNRSITPAPARSGHNLLKYSYLP